jgi:glycosyltransferase involved in cell wall biosynthesis
LPEYSEEVPTLSVVLPTLNEEEGIAKCIDRIKAALRELGVTGEIVVSDSSTDRTPEIARNMGAVVTEPDEPGYGAAYLHAFEKARGEYIAIGDADTTYDFQELPKLYRLVAEGEADMAMGSRLEGKNEPGAMPALHQYVGNPLLTKFLNVFYKAGVSDAHSGMRLISREALDELDLRTTGMEFASEMIMEAGARDLTIAEEPITYHERVVEATLESFEDGWRHVRFMLVNAPGYLFSIPGIVIDLLGVAVMGMAYFDVSLGATSFGVHSMIAGSMLALLGFQIGSLGVFATIAGNPIREPEDRITGWITANVTLEYGATAGTIVFTAGAGYATFLVTRWAASGFTRVPLLMSDVVAFTSMILGVQIVFGSFFLSAVADE